MPKNNARTWTVVSAVLTAAGAVMITAGIIAGDYDHYWMIMVGALAALTFLICFFVFAGQARRLDSLFKGRDLLAHWLFGAGEQDRKSEKVYRERKAAHRTLLLIVTFFFVLIGGIFLIFGFDDADEALMFLAIMGGALALIWIVALLAPGAAYRKMRRSRPEVFVGPFGAWVMGQYTQWKAPLTRMKGVRLLREETGAVIEVSFCIYQRYGYQEHICRIPAPDGREEEARQVAAEIAERNHTTFEE